MIELLIIFAVLGFLGLIVAANMTTRPLTNAEILQRNNDAIAAVQSFEARNGRKDDYNYIVSEVQTEKMGTMLLVTYLNDENNNSLRRFVDPESFTVVVSDDDEPVMLKIVEDTPDD